MRHITAAMLIGLTFTLTAATDFFSFLGEYNSLRDDVLRVHILANSDSEADQELKLEVRDAILDECSGLFGGVKSLDETEIIAIDNMDYIRSVAQKTVREKGYDYDVRCELVNMEFDSRVYDDITMPAGSYEALRITIGDAGGKNWWCVMYPPLCIPVAEENLCDYFSEEEIDMMKNPQKYEVKFKCAEWYEEIKERLTAEQ